MDLAIVLAAVSGTCWALNIVIVRWALERTGSPPLIGAAVGISVAAVVALAVALISSQPPPGAGDLWRFALVGAIAPGSSQGLFVAAIGSIGPSRASVLVGTAPMFSVLLAILLLGERLQAVIIVGTLLTVAGSALIGWERGGGLRRMGVGFALATAVTFAIRDVVARHFGSESDVSSWWAGALVLGAASLVLFALVAASTDPVTITGKVRTALPWFACSGVTIGLALPLLLEALDRGRVSVVAPLSNAVQNLAVVALAAVVFGAGERTPRVMVALALVVAGGALIAAA